MCRSGESRPPAAIYAGIVAMPEDAPSYTALPAGSNADHAPGATSNEAPDDEQSDESTQPEESTVSEAVSYTHLTLPTICSV